METDKKLADIILDVLQTEVSREGKNTLFVNYENWDSMNFMLLIMDIERIFRISLTNDEIVDMNCFSKALEIINMKISVKSGN